MSANPDVSVNRSSISLGIMAVLLLVSASSMYGCSSEKSSANLAMLEGELTALSAPPGSTRTEYILNQHPTQVTVLETYRVTENIARATDYYLAAFESRRWKLCDRRVSWDRAQISYTLRKDSFYGEIGIGNNLASREIAVSLTWDAFYVPKCD
jgi:hypothetical protein